MLEVIALDLEGTLISNAMSQIPRPGLFEFLEGCKTITDRVVMYTTVKEDRFRKIAQLLVAEGIAPQWFETIEYVHWEGETKDLNLIPNNDINSSVLVDDFGIYVHDGQESQWEEIKQFAQPYPEADAELKVVLNILMQRKCNKQE
ncbi:NIF family HAD-type phosphatase [Gammaproteobacteria bacterium]|nr:NIF family HAD-type phosphatase [Gammaproteobacteria bacterium]